MAGTLTIRQARLVLPDRVVTGDLLVEEGVIAEIGPSIARSAGEEIDGSGLTVLPGVIDPQVHFREPGHTYKEDLATGSRAAAAGGVTAFLDMPNNNPVTTSVERLEAKLALAAEKSVVHYGFFMGANGENNDEIVACDRTPGVKVMMGPSSEGLRLEGVERLEHIFAAVGDKVLAVHAESGARIRERQMLYEGRAEVRDHPKIRDVEAALSATRHAVDLSHKHGRRLHLLHLSTAEEVDFLATVDRTRITAEVTPHHLFLDEEVYERLGARAQTNPPIRGGRHMARLLARLRDGTIDCIASDHAPHTAEEKARPYPQSPSGVPGVEWALPVLLDRVNRGELKLCEVARWMSDGPAHVYGIGRKGRLEVGYDADLAIVDMSAVRTVGDARTWTRAGWSPWEGQTLTGWPVMTAVLGQLVFRDGEIIDGIRGRELTFS
ncbi:MAG: dihydroorotase [Deltaproteobacteria bacterium]|nr:MAG: dihydroorotase [Deltaproteobacteria bacterium]